MAAMENYLVSPQAEMATEAEWILACLRSGWEPGVIDSLREGGAIDWEQLLEIAHRERVSPLIYSLARDHGVFPPHVLERLQGVYHQNLVRNTHLMAAAENLVTRMVAEGIPVLLIKGAALIEAGYQNPALRPMADLDLLIPSAHIGIACSILQESGYNHSTLEPWPDFNQRFRQVIEFHKTNGARQAFYLDLHLGILDIPYYGQIPIDEIMDRAFKVNQQNSVPSFEDHFLILCGHLGLHERYDAPLIRYYDIARLIQEEGFSWSDVLDRAGEWQLVIPTQRTMQILGSIWPGIIPEEVLQNASAIMPEISERRIHSLVVDRQRNPTSDVLFYFATLPGFSRKTRFFLEQAFPSPDYMRRLYCPNHPSLWPLTYLLRAGLVFQYLSRALYRTNPT